MSISTLNSRILAFASVLLCACAPLNEKPIASTDKINISILAFNDLHGHLEPPSLSVRERIDGNLTEVPAGGAAYLAAAIQHHKKLNPLHAVVSAGDMIGATPLISALFLDEPTIEAVNAMGIDFNAVGNHEFDKGTPELLRMRHGGCEKLTRLEPCQVNRQFPGANFEFLGANIKKSDHQTLFPAYGIKTFKQGSRVVKVGFVGMTLKGTPNLVTPEGVQGLRFEDEASTANALVPVLKAQGVSALVLVIHEGGVIQGGHNDSSCPGLSGDIVPILNKLDPGFDVVVSGHTHRAYACDYSKINPSKPFLLTSAGQYGTFLTHIQLSLDPVTNKVQTKTAQNVIVQSEAFVNAAGVKVSVSASLPFFGKQMDVEKIVNEYRIASQVQVQKVVSHLSTSITRKSSPSGESVLGNLIADAQWASTASESRGRSDFALMNPGGVRADIVIQPGGGSVNFGQLFKVQPFGNTLVVKRMTGQQVKDLLEHQFANNERPRVLFPSERLNYDVDRRQVAGQRVQNIRIGQKPIDLSHDYHVTMNSFLASGGDGFWQFNQAPTVSGGELDVDAFSEYLRQNPMLKEPQTNRIRML
jgi:5'-nucleotidase